MSIMKLFNQTQTITRTTSQGYINDDEEYVNGDTETLEINCNVQPYREGKNTFNNPTGFRTIDAWKVYSKQELRCADEIDNTVGDQMIINGKEYYCKDLEVWTPQTYNSKSMIPEHYLGYFYRKDKS